MHRKIFGLLVGFFAVCQAAQAQTSATWTVTGSWGGAGYARVGDFNGDGRPDIASPSGANVYMKFGTGAGFVSHTWTVNPPATWLAATNTYVGDFTCDGKDDFAQIGATFVTVFVNDSSPGGSFTPTSFTTAPPPLGSYDNTRVKVGDFNNDNCSDLAILDSGGTTMTLLTKAFGTTFGVSTAAISGPWGGSAWSFIGDFNCDGVIRDFASFDGSNAYIKIYNPSTGAFFSSNQSVSPSTWGAAGFARAGKFDNDCYPDVASPQGASIYFKQNTNPNFAGVTWSVANSWGSSDWTFAGDFNGDGKDDFASANGANVFTKFAP
jgi:hypothetical protein